MGASLKASVDNAGEAGRSVVSPHAIPRVSVMGVGIHTVNLDSALSAIFWATHAAGVRGYVTATGVHGVIESQNDPDIQVIHNRSLLSLPDGVPMVWFGRSQGHARMSQVAGVDFMRAVFARSAGSNRRHYLWGGGDGVADILKHKLIARNPGVVIVGVETPPFRPLTHEEELALVDHINRTRPHFFWVALSTPKQERFMARFLERHGGSLQLDGQGFIMIGVGAAFDFEAGLVKEAPRWLRGSGMEWLYRLIKEPKRLWKRYLRNNPRFILGILRQQLQPSRFPMRGYDRRGPFDYWEGDACAPPPSAPRDAPAPSSTLTGSTDLMDGP